MNKFTISFISIFFLLFLNLSCTSKFKNDVLEDIKIMNSSEQTIDTVSAESNGIISIYANQTFDEVENTIDSIAEPEDFGNYTIEEIKKFHSDIIIDTLGVITVQESITIYANGNKFRRGLLRNIPSFRIDKYNRKFNVNFEILDITKNGEKEAYKSSYVNDNFEIKIGDPNKLLSPNIYTYEITYRLQDQIGFFDTYDELYWNVTGNEWDFYIENVSATVHLPIGTQLIQNACYTGEKGSTLSNCYFNVTDNTDGTQTVNFNSIDFLSSYQGFTIATGFTPNVIKRGSLWSIWWNIYGRISFVTLVFFMTLSYYMITWYKYGKNAKKEIVIPTFEIPNNYSASAIRYLYKRKLDPENFVCTIVQLAVKRFLNIKLENKTYTLVNNNKPLNGTESDEEKIVITKLLKSRKNIAIRKSSATILNATKNKFETKIIDSIELSEFCDKNSTLKRSGFLYLIGSLIGMIAIYSFTGKFLIYTISGLIAFFIILKVFKKIKTCLLLCFYILGTFALIFIIPIVLINYQGAYKEILLILIGITIVTYIIYFKMMNRITEKGRKMATQIEGLKMYLSTAEEHRLNMLYTPEKTPELYEKMLPYAMALDIENKWGNKFVNIFESISYQPVWIDSSTDFSHSFSRSISSGLASSIKAATYIPPSSSSSSDSNSGSSGGSWSSGSSGGGSSGGGGGGGGGGGW